MAVTKGRRLPPIRRRSPSWSRSGQRHPLTAASASGRPRRQQHRRRSDGRTSDANTASRQFQSSARHPRLFTCDHERLRTSGRRRPAQAHRARPHPNTRDCPRGPSLPRRPSAAKSGRPQSRDRGRALARQKRETPGSRLLAPTKRDARRGGALSGAPDRSDSRRRPCAKTDITSHGGRPPTTNRKTKERGGEGRGERGGGRTSAISTHAAVARAP